MTDIPRICICGGGNIAHSLAAVLSNVENVAVYTRSPDVWRGRLSYLQGDSVIAHESRCNVVATDEVNVVAGAESVFVSVPRFAVHEMMSKILPVLHNGQTVLFCPGPSGMEEIVETLSKRGVATVGFQRVPYVARIYEYGRLVWIGDVRRVTRYAVSSDDIKAKWAHFIERRFGGRAIPLSSFLSFTFSNSNPLLHPSRLIELLQGANDGCYDKCPLFYAEWTDRSSRLYIDADNEMFRAFDAYSHIAANADYESAMKHYETVSVEGMTQKIRSIESLHYIRAPWKELYPDLWVPDLSSRYFTEDIPYGTKIIQAYAKRVGVATPTIDLLVSEIESRLKSY